MTDDLLTCGRICRPVDVPMWPASLPKILPVKLQRAMHVLFQVLPTMVSGKNGKLVRKAFLGEDTVKLARAFIETIAVMITAIKREPQASELFRVLGQMNSCSAKSSYFLPPS